MNFLSIMTWTKLLTIRRRYFSKKYIFLKETFFFYFDSNFIELCFLWSSWHVSIGGGDGLAPNITWINTADTRRNNNVMIT